jgi:hypothetical protein
MTKSSGIVTILFFQLCSFSVGTSLGFRVSVVGVDRKGGGVNIQRVIQDPSRRILNSRILEEGENTTYVVSYVFGPPRRHGFRGYLSKEGAHLLYVVADNSASH